MKQFFALVALALVTLGVFGEGLVADANLVSGKLTVNIQPKESGLSGSWKAVIVSSTGRHFDGPIVDASDNRLQSIEVKYDPANLMTGVYTIQIKNSLGSASDEAQFIDYVEIVSTLENQGPVVYRHIPASKYGDIQLFAYQVFPSYY